MLDGTSVMDPDNFSAVADSARDARHGTIDAMRAELGVAGSARPGEGYNPFVGIRDLEEKYARGKGPRPGRAG